MATKATIFKADLQIVDMDRNYYQDHALTLARHPSETDERMMLRLLADLWQKDLTGTIELWIELGQPDEKRIRKACGRSQQVVIYSYSGNSAGIWWEQNGTALAKIKNLSVLNIATDNSKALAQLAQRNMQLQATIQDGAVWMADNESNVEVTPEVWQQAR